MRPDGSLYITWFVIIMFPDFKSSIKLSNFAPNPPRHIELNLNPTMSTKSYQNVQNFVFSLFNQRENLSLICRKKNTNARYGCKNVLRKPLSKNERFHNRRGLQQCVDVFHVFSSGILFMSRLELQHTTKLDPVYTMVTCVVRVSERPNILA